MTDRLLYFRHPYFGGETLLLACAPETCTCRGGRQRVALVVATARHKFEFTWPDLAAMLASGVWGSELHLHIVENPLPLRRVLFLA